MSTPDQRDCAMLVIADQLRRWQAAKEFSLAYDDAHPRIVSTLNLSVLQPAVANAARGLFPERITGDVLTASHYLKEEARETWRSAKLDPVTCVVAPYLPIAGDLYDCGYRISETGEVSEPDDRTPGEADLDAHTQALTEKVAQWHRDGVLTLAYNADRTEVSSRLPLSVLPEAAAKAAREQYPDAIDGDTLVGLVRIGASTREEGLATDETIAPDGLLAQVLVQRLAVDLLALGC